MPQASEARFATRPDPVVVARDFAAPRGVVFQAWSSAHHMRRWFCPAHFSVPHATVDFRPGGVLEICMRGPDGREHWSKGHYVEILPPDRLVFTTGLFGDDAAPRFIAHTTVIFAEDAGVTRVTVHQAYDIHDASALAAIEGAPEGWRTTLGRLDQEVARIGHAVPDPSDARPAVRSVVHAMVSIERRYPAAPARVFRALTDPAAKAKWFGGGDAYETLEREMDVRPSGRERVRGRWTSGTISLFDAVYHDVVPDT